MPSKDARKARQAGEGHVWTLVAILYSAALVAVGAALALFGGGHGR